ncbi:hypothetical protein CerSpe_069710 [Prunus speciosa]
MTHDDNLLLSNAPVTSRFALPQRRSRFDHLDRQHHPEGSQVGQLPCRLEAHQRRDCARLFAPERRPSWRFTAFVRISGPSSVSHLVLNFRKRLCGNDPGVMSATLCPLFDLITVDVKSYKDLVVSFVSILQQVAGRRLPKTHDYHQLPAPFINIRLLKILALISNPVRRCIW